MKYDVIYADPAWRYDFSKSKNRDVENQYPTMTIDDIILVARHKDRGEFSMSKAGIEADKFITRLRE